ncbi:MAG: DUF4123 domain-containing protein [Pyrinomonadaceae bacterium]
MRLALEITSGPLLGKKILASPNQVVRIGRTTKADFATDDGFMSSEHFAIEGNGTVWKIRDLKSRNGTKLNGQKIDSAELHEGDTIHAGSTDFIVRLEQEEVKRTGRVSKKLLSTLPPAIPVTEPPLKRSTKEVSDRRATRTEKPVTSPQQQRAKRPKPTVTRKAESSPAVPQATPEPSPTGQPVAPSRAANIAPANAGALHSYEAATPGGRLLRLLQTQSQPLLALLDATHEPRLPKLLQESGEEVCSLYENFQSASLAPYLVSLPPDSELLARMVREGWGNGWGVYLTTNVPLAQLRDYFRRELMVRLPDGVELFSRFYDPRFFRAFLDTCTGEEAEKFFGPVNSYLMEDEKPEIVLQYKLTSAGVEKKGHLLSETVPQ